MMDDVKLLTTEIRLMIEVLSEENKHLRAENAQLREKLPQDVIAALNRIFGLTVIKDDESDDAYDGLYKIGRVAREVLMKYDEGFRETTRKVLGTQE